MKINIYNKSNPYGNFNLIEKDLISTHIYHHDVWEPHLLYFYCQMIKPHHNIIDCGANIGFHTVQFGKLIKQGIVYSFEPQPVLFNILNLNILSNNLTLKIRPISLAVSNTNKLFKMSSIEEQIFNKDIVNYGGRRLIDEGNGEIVNSITLDNIFKDSNINIYLIKLDIQGHELEAIDGAKFLIHSCHPVFFIENYITEIKDQQVLSTLINYGYKIYRIEAMNNEDCIALHPNYHSEEINLVNNQTEYKIIAI